MCIPTWPGKGERKPLGVLSGNNLLPIFNTGAARTSPTTCFDIKDADSGEAFFDGSRTMQPSIPAPAVDVLSNERSPMDKDFGFVLSQDICEVFDEETLRELDDICKNAAAPASGEFSVKPCPMTASRDHPVVPLSGVTQDELLDVEMRAPEWPASSACLSVAESVSVSSRPLANFISAGGGLGEEPTNAGASALNELLVVTDEGPANLRDTQYSTLDSKTTADRVSPAVSKLNFSLASMNPLSSGVSVAQPSTAVAVDGTTCDSGLPDFLKKLNATQLEAATSDTLKPLLILAGPGSGKVRPHTSWIEILTMVLSFVVDDTGNFYACLPSVNLMCTECALQTSTMVARLLTLLREV